MKSPFYLRHGRVVSVGQSHGVVPLASLLAFGVVSWEHVIHAYFLGHGDTLAGHLTHMVRDGFLALPLALLAVTGSLWLAQRLGMRHHTWLDLLGRAAIISITFALLLVPAVGVHNRIDAALLGKGGAFIPNQALEAASLRGLTLHGIHDALIGQVAALPLALLGLILLALAQDLWPRGQQPSTGCQQARGRWVRRALTLAPAGVVLLAIVSVGLAKQPVVTFDTTDNPGPWFKCVSGTGCVPPSTASTESLAVVRPGDVIRINIGADTNTVHTFTSLVFPTGTQGMPFDQPSAFRGTMDVALKKAGLYVFVCKLHPFMLAAVIADDPKTPELDLGQSITLITGITVPTASDLASRLARAFFVITNPSNWQVHSASGATTWDPAYAPVPVLAFDANQNPVSIPNLHSFLRGYFNQPVTLAAPTLPSTPGVGEVWIDTEYELTAGKTKPGTATAVDTSTWQVTKKVALPQINMNNPHNMWTDRDQKVIYQTQWFDTKLTVFDRNTGKLLRNVEVGEAPAHVMTRVDTDQVHVSLNGEGGVVELAPLATQIDRIIPVQFSDENPAQPHAHWMSFDGQTMVTPNSNTNDSTRIDVVPGTIAAKTPTGTLPIASSIMPDASKYYVSNYLDSTITCISIGPPSCKNGTNTVEVKTIHLLLGGTGLANYDPIGGTGFATSGALPIQTPVSPNGKYVVTANTLTGTITIIDTDTDTLVKVLPCDAGCHGVNFGAKRGGGYYAYVSSKFSNRLIVVDPDPNNDGDPSDAAVVGSVVLVAASGTHTDDSVTAYAGMGGQGVLPIPLVYNGWVQNLPQAWRAKLTTDQLNPLP